MAACSVEDFFIVAQIKGWKERKYEKENFYECSEKGTYCFGCYGGMRVYLGRGAECVCGGSVTDD